MDNQIVLIQNGSKDHGRLRQCLETGIAGKEALPSSTRKIIFMGGEDGGSDKWLAQSKVYTVPDP